MFPAQNLRTKQRKWLSLWSMNTKNRITQAIVAVLVTVGFLACNTMYDATGKSPDDIFVQAKKRFDDNDLIEAQRLFDIIKLQYPASQFADDAQYYIAEINFKRKEFIVAAFNYNYVRRLYSQSEYAKSALYKAALCYVELSPPFDRDQDYTRKAIVALGDFQREYPKDSLAEVAATQIKELRDKLGEREFRVAEQYRVLLAPKSALVYYDAVIDDYSDTKFCEPAFVGKVEVLTQLKRSDEALAACALYKRFFPKGELAEKMEALKNAIPLTEEKAGK